MEIVYNILSGVAVSLITLLIQILYNRSGKLQIFAKTVFLPNESGKSWGFSVTGQGDFISFKIPIRYEIVNTSKTARIVRDINLLLYNDDKLVMTMTQGEYIRLKKIINNSIWNTEEKKFGGDKGEYSFVITPNCINRWECLYTAHIYPFDKESKYFNRVVVRYFDEKNKAHFCELKKLNGNWEAQDFEKDEEWVMIK